VANCAPLGEVRYLCSRAAKTSTPSRSNLHVALLSFRVVVLGFFAVHAQVSRSGKDDVCAVRVWRVMWGLCDCNV
jgi:hypothetical protein